MNYSYVIPQNTQMHLDVIQVFSVQKGTSRTISHWHRHLGFSQRTHFSSPVIICFQNGSRLGKATCHSDILLFFHQLVWNPFTHLALHSNIFRWLWTVLPEQPNCSANCTTVYVLSDLIRALKSILSGLGRSWRLKSLNLNFLNHLWHWLTLMALSPYALHVFLAASVAFALRWNSYSKQCLIWHLSLARLDIPKICKIHYSKNYYV